MTKQQESVQLELSRKKTSYLKINGVRPIPLESPLSTFIIGLVYDKISAEDLFRPYKHIEVGNPQPRVAREITTRTP